MKEILKLCEEGKFEDALRLITLRIDNETHNSEIYRIKGQAELELEQIDDSIDSLIESLKIDPNNEHALILIGNIYNRHKDDFPTAQKYFTKVLSLNSHNYIGLNNLGGIYAQREMYDEAIEFFDKALTVLPGYANALFGKALIAFNSDQPLKAFDLARKVSTNSVEPQNDEEKTVHGQAFKLMSESAKGYLNKIDEESLFAPLKVDLEIRGKTPIEIVSDNTISTFAKIEIAENYGRDKHIVKINQNKKGYSYYGIHELLHLQLILDAREVGENEVFTSTPLTLKKFTTKASKDPKFKKLLNSLGDKASGLIDKLYDGLMLQVYNAPLDLFIEKIIFDTYPTVRPLQFLGLLEMADQALKGATDLQIKRQFPSFVRESNIVMSTTQFLQIKEFYGVDLTNNIKEKVLIKKGINLFSQFKELENDKSPAEEYDLLRWWAEDLNLVKFFELIPESPERGTSSVEEFISQLENDPYNLEGDTSFEDEQVSKFVSSQEGSGLNMAVLYYLIDALQHFKIIPKQKIKDIGFEIATLGRSGIDPNKSDRYSLATVPNKEFTGWMLLSWMYAAWMDFDPDMVPSFQLNFEKELKLAQGLSE